MSLASPVPRTEIPSPLHSAHLIGIGGSGMYPLAQALRSLGVAVSGSDLETTKEKTLRAVGVTFHQGHSADNIAKPEVVVMSTAIPADNPELATARLRGIPVIHRSEMLGWFLKRQKSVLIAGTHGKTTTTAIVGLLLEHAGVDPWCFVGGNVPQFSGNVRVGGGELAVAEADESDGSFLNLPRHDLLITNIEAEHLNHWKDMAHLEAGFQELVAGLAKDGSLVVCVDDPGIMKLLATVKRPYTSYSLEDPDADYYATALRLSGDNVAFDLYAQHHFVGRAHLGIPGRHNVANALGAFALVASLGVELERVLDSLREYHGVDRRFTKRSNSDGLLVIDDYAHHPTEINATMQAARTLADERGGRLIALFQPHRYSRMSHVMNQFNTCFKPADELIVTEIYSGGESPIPGVSGQKLYDKITAEYTFPVHFAHDLEEAKKTVLRRSNNIDVVLLLGAGSVTKLAPVLAVPADSIAPVDGGLP